MADQETAFKNVVAVFPARDIREAIDFYETLGFTEVFHVTESGGYAGIRRGNVDIHLFACDRKEIAEWTSCRVGVEGIDALYEEYLKLGVVHPNGKLALRPWGLREFAILDPSGALITFFEAPAAPNA